MITELAFGAIACFGFVLLGILIHWQKLSLKLGVILNTILFLFGIGGMMLAAKSDWVPIFCELLMVVPTMDICLVFVVRYSARRQTQSE